MKTIETDATVTQDGQLTLALHLNVPPGQYRVLVVLEEPAPVSTQRPPLNLPVVDVGTWPEDLSLRREDMYGDDGR